MQFTYLADIHQYSTRSEQQHDTMVNCLVFKYVSVCHIRLRALPGMAFAHGPQHPIASVSDKDFGSNP